MDKAATMLPVEVVMPVRFGDIDMMGHVNNAVFITMMEQARVLYCERLPGFEFSKFTPPLGISFILASITCDFKAPIRFAASIRIRTGVTRLGRSSLTMAYELADATSAQIVATGSSVQVCYDYRVGQSTPLPDTLRRQIADLEKWPVDDVRRTTR